MDNTEALLKEITEANGVSGYEDEVRKIMAREMGDLADSVEYDRMGSILAACFRLATPVWMPSLSYGFCSTHTNGPPLGPLS